MIMRSKVSGRELREVNVRRWFFIHSLQARSHNIIEWRDSSLVYKVESHFFLCFVSRAKSRVLEVKKPSVKFGYDNTHIVSAAAALLMDSQRVVMLLQTRQMCACSHSFKLQISLNHVRHAAAEKMKNESREAPVQMTNKPMLRATKRWKMSTARCMQC